MADVFTARNLAQAYLIVHALSDAGIRSSVRNEQLVGAAGDVPVSPEGWPTVEVADGDADAAREVIRGLAETTEAGDGSGDFADDDGYSDSGEMQESLSNLHLAARSLTRHPRDGKNIDVVAGFVEMSESVASPFGVEPQSWTLLRETAQGLLTAASQGNDEAVQSTAEQLEAAAAPLVGAG